MKNTYCEECGELMQRWGTTAAGTPRYRCRICKKSRTIHRPDTHLRHDKDRLASWLTGVENKTAVAKRYGVSRQALSQEFKTFFRENPDGMAPSGFTAKMLINPENPKVRTIRMVVEAENISTPEAAPRYWKAIMSVPPGVNFEMSLENRFRAVIESELFEFLERESKAIARFYNPRDSTQQKEFERLAKGSLNSRLLGKGMQVKHAQFTIPELQ